MTRTTIAGSPAILQADEPHPLEIHNAEGGSDFFLICEHAGRVIPRSLGDMGLTEEERQMHIAWDIGAKNVALKLAQLLDAPLFTQHYSRLVCDCNRRPDVATFTPARSEATDIPANVGLSEEERNARADAIFWPFHNAVSEALDAREKAGRRTLLVTIHSFTPVYLGKNRPWEIGVLFNRDKQFSPAIVEWLEANTQFCVGSNEPYSVGDDTDYAIPVHGEKRGLPCVEFEIRNDLIRTVENAEKWAETLAVALKDVAATLDVEPANVA